MHWTFFIFSFSIFIGLLDRQQVWYWSPSCGWNDLAILCLSLQSQLAIFLSPSIFAVMQYTNFGVICLHITPGLFSFYVFWWGISFFLVAQDLDYMWALLEVWPVTFDKYGVGISLQFSFGPWSTIYLFS